MERERARERERERRYIVSDGQTHTLRSRKKGQTYT